MFYKYNQNENMKVVRNRYIAPLNKYGSSGSSLAMLLKSKRKQ